MNVGRSWHNLAMTYQQTQPPKTANGFALTALIVGIGAFLIGWMPLLGLLAGIAALVFGILAIKKHQTKWMGIIGIALGGAAIVASLAVSIAVGASLENAQEQQVIVEEPEAEPIPVPADEQEPVEPAPAPEPVAPALDETTAAQYLAHSWENLFPYGGSVHWILDRITTANDDGTYTFKIGATIKNEYGTKISATIEGDVGGTTDNPVILDSILYTNTGEIIEYPR